MSQKNYSRNERRTRIKRHIRKRVLGTSDKPRLTVYRSIKSISAQLIDDTQDKTLFTVSSQSKSLADTISKAKSKVEVATLVGKTAAEEALKMDIKQVVFDRNGFLYHGRVKAVAEGAREAGLKF